MASPNPIKTEPNVPDADLDADLDMNLDPNAQTNADAENPELDTSLPQSREPTRKDISLREFLGKMDDYAPIVRPSPHPSKQHIPIAPSVPSAPTLNIPVP